MANVLKIVFLGIIGFGLLVYLTAPKQNSVKKSSETLKNNSLKVSSLPTHYEVIGINGYEKRENIFQADSEKFIIILNHDALSLIESLKTFIDKDIVLVANISKTPWFIQKMAVDGKLEELNLNSKIPMINDSNANLISALNLNDDTQTKYFIFKVKKDSSIMKVAEGFVKEGAMENGLTKDELEKSVKLLLSQLK
ncbi:hypothetical protein [Poseidonibacter sp.]|uniref:hypothetical protein n=1 Tax=Poseidonibacter sp. TaxID=2321188 RepID=UPI003C72C4D4